MYFLQLVVSHSDCFTSALARGQGVHWPFGLAFPLQPSVFSFVSQQLRQEGPFPRKSCIHRAWGHSPAIGPWPPLVSCFSCPACLQTCCSSRAGRDLPSAPGPPPATLLPTAWFVSWCSMPCAPGCTRAGLCSVWSVCAFRSLLQESFMCVLVTFLNSNPFRNTKSPFIVFTPFKRVISCSPS